MANNNQQVDARTMSRSRDVQHVKDGVLYIQHCPKKGGAGRAVVELTYDADIWGDFVISNIPPERIRILPEVSS